MDNDWDECSLKSVYPLLQFLTTMGFGKMYAYFIHQMCVAYKIPRPDQSNAISNFLIFFLKFLKKSATSDKFSWFSN